jgi:hypothetical protein
MVATPDTWLIVARGNCRRDSWTAMESPARRPPDLLRYAAGLSAGRLLLWCYFTWYLVVLVRYFEPDPRLWMTSAGMSAIIGIALYVSTTASAGVSGRLGFWPTVRLFMMPFCVSSFAALVKGKGFYLVFSPRGGDLAWGVGLCGTVLLLAFVAKSLHGWPARTPQED